ncbi:ABC transporter ATP-binding [Lecanosticta acicola]|uniref:ABC transporter ATP-binding n=1 Tax=Lecanosticta acicola TaxID=111012 RepID=A0AAI8YVM4_9PEZI|nr:ABC transporter ATP-binding [Lecanosticta acicola]
MWKRLPRARHQCRFFHTTRRWREPEQPRHNTRYSPNVIAINKASFYRQYPSDDSASSNPALFPDLSFFLPYRYSRGGNKEYWAVISDSSVGRTAFLQVLAGQYICIPPTARTYPYLSDISTSPQHAVKYIGFDAERGTGVGGNNVRGAYLSARYESRREETDYSVLDYLSGKTQLNALERDQSEASKADLQAVVEQLNLSTLLQMPVANLSNGQTRRARIAKALMARPEVLLLDGPFMGLDPNTSAMMDSLLEKLATSENPRVIMSLRPEDGIPDWITHLVITDDSLKILDQGSKGHLYTRRVNKPLRADATKPRTAKMRAVYQMLETAQNPHNKDITAAVSRDGWTKESAAFPPGEALVEMQGVKVAYGDKVVLGNWKQDVEGEEKPGLWWNLHRGQRCGIFGPNGSGKTTMLSLITSDHPQTYSLPIKLFGRSRLPGPGEPGISLFDIQRRMGHSSPEVHAFFPKRLTVRRTIESAWADAPLARAKLTAEADRRVDAFLRWFARELNPKQATRTTLEAMQDAFDNLGPGGSREAEAVRRRRYQAAHRVLEETTYDDSDLAWADDTHFAELSFSSQRLALFLRALVATPDLVILDEALSGIDDKVRDKALLFLSHGEKIARVENGVAEPSMLAQIDKMSFEGLSPGQALLVISHAKEDVPGCLREWICLPEPGEEKAPRSGTLAGPLELNLRGWDAIWGKQ